MRRPIAVDLFAGAGGMSLGFEQAGFDVVAAVEYDPVHAATHAYNFPGTEVLCRDVGALTAKRVMAAAKRGFERMYPDRQWPGKVDAVIGGPPCQGFSTGGKREDGDERNLLLLQFARLVKEIKPKVVCLENVAGLLESRFDEVRVELFNALESAGYSLSGVDAVLNCVDFGVPQKRKRLIVLGKRGKTPPGRPAPINTEVTVEAAFSGLPLLANYPALLAGDEVTLKSADIKRRANAKFDYARQLAGIDPIPGDVGYEREWRPSMVTSARRTVHTEATVERFAGTLQGKVEPKSRLFRLSLNAAARTLRAGTGAERGAHTSPRPIHPTEDRVITVREAARLHGYPDWFRFHTTNWHGHRQVGNSVPPPMARAAAVALLEALGDIAVEPDRCFLPEDVNLLSLSKSEALSRFETVAAELPRGRTRPATDEPDAGVIEVA